MARPVSSLQQICPVTYEVDVFDRRKQKECSMSTYCVSGTHHQRVPTGLRMLPMSWIMRFPHGRVILQAWRIEGLMMGNQLDAEQKDELQRLLDGYPEVMRGTPG